MTVFSEKLDGLGETITRALVISPDEIAAALRRDADSFATAIGSGGSAITAAYLATCRRTLGFAPTWVTTPADFVLSGEQQARGGPVWLFSASGDNPDILAALEAARDFGAKAVHVVTSNGDGELAVRAEEFGFAVHLAPTADPKDGFLATHTLASAVTLLLMGSSRAAAGGPDDTLQERFRATTALLLRPERRAELVESFAGLTGTDALFVLQDPRLEGAALAVETSAWEAALCPVQRVDFRNFAHGRHVWAARRPEGLFVLALTGYETREMWKQIDASLPNSVRRKTLDYADCGRFRNAAGMVEALTIVEAVGAVVGIDPGRPGVGDFGRDIYDSAALRELARALTAPIRAKRAAVALHDPEDAADHDLIACGTDVRAQWSSSHITGLVLDYDGTLVTLEDRYEPLRADLAASLAGLLTGGLRLAIATGRGKSAGKAMRDALPPDLHRDVLIGYYNGACIRDLPAALEDQQPEPAPDILAAFDWLVSSGRARPDRIKNSGVQLTLPLDAVPDLQALRAELTAAGHTRLRLAQTSHTVDICLAATCKTAVVEALASRWGLPIGTVMRVGDSGGPQGNDHALLACGLGVSVGQVCARPREGWSPFGPELSGPDALLRLLDALRPVAFGRFRLDLGALEACD